MSSQVVGISVTIPHAARNVDVGVPALPCMGRRAHRRWYRPGRPGRRYALVRRERREDVRVDSVLAGPGGGTVLVRLLGADHHSLRICLNLSLRYSHKPDSEFGPLDTALYLMSCRSRSEPC